MKDLVIGLSAWIIQDGNYGDFEAGQEYRFALEYHPHSLELHHSGATSLRLIGGSDYEYSGRAVLADSGLTVLDVGLLCYCCHDGSIELVPKLGQWARGRLYLGVDPFSWFESLSQRPDAPDLTYEWRLKRILLETTPWEGPGRELIKPFEGPRTYREVVRTNAWEGDRGMAEYLLECEVLGGPYPAKRP